MERNPAKLMLVKCGGGLRGHLEAETEGARQLARTPCRRYHRLFLLVTLHGCYGLAITSQRPATIKGTGSSVAEKKLHRPCPVCAMYPGCVWDSGEELKRKRGRGLSFSEANGTRPICNFDPALPDQRLCLSPDS